MILQRTTSVRAIAAATARRLTTEVAATEEKIAAEVVEVGGSKSKTGSGGAREKLRRSLIKLVHTNRSAVVTLQKWTEEGNKAQKYQLNRIVRELRSLKRFKHALEVCEWMKLQPDIKLVAGDYAVHLDLISKVRGLPSAEKFFEDLPDNMRGHLACTSLLHSYVQNKLPEKAEALMEKMTECGFLKNPLPFNHLLSMYIASKQLEKIPQVMQKLRTHTTPDIFTYNLLLTACAGHDDVETAEKTFKELKKAMLDPDWVTFSILANLYVKKKLHERALPMLKEMEKKASRDNRLIYPSLISLYASIGDSDAIHRIWDQMKSCFHKMNDAEYICMVSSLVKLDELLEAEKVFSEWESISTSNNPGIANVLLAGYINKDQLQEAQNLHKRMERKRLPPCYTTWELLTSVHLKKGDTKTALDCFKKAITSVKKFIPDTMRIQKMFSMLEQQDDIKGAEQLLIILRNAGHSSTEVYNSLLRTYAHAGKMPLIVMERMKKDNVDPDEETLELIEKTRNMPVSEAASFISAK